MNGGFVPFDVISEDLARYTTTIVLIVPTTRSQRCRLIR